MMGAFDDLIPGGGGSMIGGGRKLSPQDAKALNEMRETSAASGNVADLTVRARDAAQRLKTGPYRGRVLDAFIPEEGGGFFDAVGGIIGAPFIDAQTVTDFQSLKALQNDLVLTKQLEQKGPQTESDAARLKLSQVSPYKSLEANEALLGPALTNAISGKNRVSFYTKWANQNGLNGLDAQGRSADEVWGGMLDAARGKQQAAVRAGKPMLGVAGDAPAKPRSMMGGGRADAATSQPPRRQRYNPATGEIE